jgi:acyl carrier protein
MDFLNFVIGLHKELSVEIPEADYPQLVTMNGLVAYLERARASSVCGRMS